MELTLILILILLSAIIPIKIFQPTLTLLAGLLTIIDTVTLPTILSISGETINYSTLDPMTQWALGLILITTAAILYLNQMDVKPNDNNEP